MSTNHHTPYVDGPPGTGTPFSMAAMGAPLGQLDQAITDLIAALAIVQSAYGEVSSVGVTVPGELEVSGSPITDSGTIAISWKTQAARKFLAAPVSGDPALPVFREIVLSDLPVQPFDVYLPFRGKPLADEELIFVPLGRNGKFPADFSGSVARSKVAATGTTVFVVKLGATTIGSFTFAPGATTATFTTTGNAEVSFSAGDLLSIVAPSTPDATIETLGMVFLGIRL